MNSFGDSLKKAKASKQVASEIARWCKDMEEASSYLYDTREEMPASIKGENNTYELIKKGCEDFLNKKE